MSPNAQRAYDAVKANEKAEVKLRAAIKKADRYENDRTRGPAFEKARLALDAAESAQNEKDIAAAEAVAVYVENYGQ